MLADQILGGQHDTELDALSAAIRDRRSTLAARTTASLAAGDSVLFSDLIRPAYLVGKAATVVKVNPKSVIVTCPSDPAYGRFSGSRNVRCPNALITVTPDGRRNADFRVTRVVV